MEIITAILATLLAITSPVGAVIDSLAEDAIRDQIAGAEELHVRVDNVPNYQVINGRVDHVRVAGRGIYPIPELRIGLLDLETDTVDVDLPSLQRGQLKLDEPAQVALHLILEADDINQFLDSAVVQQILENLRFSLPGQGGTREQNRYGLANPSLEFIEGGRLRLVLDIEDQVTAETIGVHLEIGIAIENGHRLRLLDPRILIDGEEAPPQLLTAFVAGANDQLTLRQLERLGVIARVLNFDIRNNELDIAVFAKVDPDSPLLSRETAPPAAPPDSPPLPPTNDPPN